MPYFVLFHYFTRWQEGRCSELLQEEESKLAHLMKEFAEDGSHTDKTGDWSEVCVHDMSTNEYIGMFVFLRV